MKLHEWVDISKLNWDRLSRNQNAIDLLKENPDKIDWEAMSANPNAIDILKENPEKINWEYLSRNPYAIELLKKNPDKIDWNMLSINPAIFTYDYIKMNERPFVEELMSRLYHPDKLVYYLDKYQYDIGEDEYL